MARNIGNAIGVFFLDILKIYENCGTTAGMQRHRKRNTVPCDDCRLAYRKHVRDRKEFNMVYDYGTECYLCGKEIDFKAPRQVGDDGWELSFHIDHVIPKTFGGSDDISNLRPAHGLCNIRKSNIGLKDYLTVHHPERLFILKSVDHEIVPQIKRSSFANL